MKIAFVFPGQGSQYEGMAKDFKDRFESARDIFDRADSSLGYSISKLCFEGPQSDLNLTANTQPALLTVSAVVAAAIKETAPVTVSACAGHSLGEYSALCFAESLTIDTAVSLVHERGKAMQSATPQGVGAMAAIIGLADGLADDVCREAGQGQIIQAANFNGPGQVVLSGHREAVERAILIARSKGARKGIMLPVSAPFHCALMKPAAETMLGILHRSDIRSPVIPLVNNADADYLEPTPATVIDSLYRQITAPVRWEESIRRMRADGIECFIEIGAGKVLTNMIKRIVPEAECLSVGSVDDLENFAQYVATKGLIP